MNIHKSNIIKLSPEEKKIVSNNHHKKNEKHEFVDYKNVVCIKPWGHEFLIYQTKKIGIWFLKINSGHKTSLHCHFNKDTFIVVLKGSVKVDLINNGVMNLNCMDTLFLPHYSFHGLGSYSEESYLIEIEIYNDSIDFTDKNDLLRINDQYNRPDSIYQSSVTTVCDNLQEEYDFFSLSEGFCSMVCGVDICVHKIKSDEINIAATKKPGLHILLDGVIYQDGKYIKEGSVVSSFENIQMIQDEITVLSLDKFDFKDDQKVVYHTEQLQPLVQELKKQNKKIVLSSGCFDILHVGHIQNLIGAKKMGDILMVCLSNDAQIKKLKGSARPINNYQDRIDLFKTIKYVDYVILYDEKNIATEETLGGIMKLVDPYIWAKGSDYNVEDIYKKHPYLKQIQLIPNIENKSTTNIVNKMRLH